MPLINAFTQGIYPSTKVRGSAQHNRYDIVKLRLRTKRPMPLMNRIQITVKRAEENRPIHNQRRRHHATSRELPFEGVRCKWLATEEAAVKGTIRSQDPARIRFRTFSAKIP